MRDRVKKDFLFFSFVPSFICFLIFIHTFCFRRRSGKNVACKTGRLFFGYFWEAKNNLLPVLQARKNGAEFGRTGIEQANPPIRIKSREIRNYSQNGRRFKTERSSASFLFARKSKLSSGKRWHEFCKKCVDPFFIANINCFANFQPQIATNTVGKLSYKQLVIARL